MKDTEFELNKNQKKETGQREARPIGRESKVVLREVYGNKLKLMKSRELLAVSVKSRRYPERGVEFLKKEEIRKIWLKEYKIDIETVDI